ncbi:UNVERIFIED_CONTAM: Anthocyanidin 3-O-glucosyltransferase [Sesamum calycinum]|uniref:Anthocyanidin 3-O-glucosyltransferase n=1 Tax=Sesamum calycinum TaxID=2727403 RepID=A0AAW2RUT8_9LAMI
MPLYTAIGIQLQHENLSTTDSLLFRWQNHKLLGLNFVKRSKFPCHAIDPFCTLSSFNIVPRFLNRRQKSNKLCRGCSIEIINYNQKVIATIPSWGFIKAPKIKIQKLKGLDMNSFFPVLVPALLHYPLLPPLQLRNYKFYEKLCIPFRHTRPSTARLVRRLSASVPNTRFSFFSSTVSNSTLFNERISDSYDNIQPYNVRDGTPEGFSGSHFEAVDLFLDAASGNFEKAIGEAEEETGMKICCLISDAFLWFGGDLAAKRGIPWVPFWTAASCSLSVHVYTDEILKAVGSTGKSVLLYLDLDIPEI